MKRIWIILLTASLLVLAGCGGKEPVAFSGSTESQPPGMETSADSASPVENTALQQESTENIANVKEPAEARTTEYVPAASVTTADENEAPSPEQPSSQLVNEEPESRPSEAEPEPTTPEPQEPPAPSETPPDPVGEPPEEVPAQEPEPEPDFDIGYYISKLLDRTVVVQGSCKIHRALYDRLTETLEELKRIEAGSGVDPDLLEIIQTITQIVDNLYIK